jgi:hypothetical protein
VFVFAGCLNFDNIQSFDGLLAIELFYGPVGEGN